jgi:hypothetical protein
MNSSFRKTLLRTIGVSLLAGFAAAANAQIVAPVHKPVAGPQAAPAPEVLVYRAVDSNEKAINVDKNVNLSLCVTQGTLKINGWNRGEIRVVIREGSKFDFKTKYTSPTSKLPALVSVNGYDKKNYSSECIWGEEIEIDAPMNATINIKGKEIYTTIDTVRKASVYIIGGDIILRNVAEGVTASTGQGDITVEETTGPIAVETTTGNVVVFDAGPREIGDIFKAKTNSGNLSLQQLTFRQIEVNSISGSVLFSGDIVDGASYSLGTTNGSIRLQIPPATNWQMSAVFVSGNFTTEIPYKLLTENLSEGEVKRINAKFGKGGESLVKLTTSNGSIGIKKLQ